MKQRAMIFDSCGERGKELAGPIAENVITLIISLMFEVQEHATFHSSTSSLGMQMKTGLLLEIIICHNHSR